MTTVTKAVLKTYFEQGDIPTQGQYVDLIESQFGLGESGTQIIQGTISASAAEIEYIALKKLYIPGLGVSADASPRGGAKVGSTFTIGKTLEVSGSINVTNGDISITSSGQLKIADGEEIYAAIGLGEPNRLNVGNSEHWESIRYGRGTGSHHFFGDITSSGNISGSHTSTGSFGRIEVASRIEHAQDQNTRIGFNSDTVEIFANNIQGAKFSTTAGTSLGNTTYITNITGSVINFKGNITGSNSTFTTTTVTSYISASSGINATDGALVSSVTWLDTGTILLSRRAFSLTFSSLPSIIMKQNFADEYMLVSNSQITTKSVIIVNQAALGSPAATDTQLMVSNVVAGGFRITPYCSTGNGINIPLGGAATYNFVIL